MDWRPITTAPRELKAPSIGLTAFDSAGRQLVPPVYCWWDGVEDSSHRGWSGWPQSYPSPTHWHPQPGEMNGAAE